MIKGGGRPARGRPPTFSVAGLEPPGPTRGLRTECARAPGTAAVLPAKAGARRRGAVGRSAPRSRRRGSRPGGRRSRRAPATCSTNAASGINGVDRAASFGRWRVAFACLRPSRRRSSSHSLRTICERTQRVAVDDRNPGGQRAPAERRVGRLVLVPRRCLRIWSDTLARRAKRHCRELRVSYLPP